MSTVFTTSRNPGNLTSDRLNDLVTVDQLAEMLHIKKSTVYDWCHRQKVPFYRLGKRTLFDKREIAAWLQLRKVNPTGSLR